MTVQKFVSKPTIGAIHELPLLHLKYQPYLFNQKNYLDKEACCLCKTSTKRRNTPLIKR